MPDANVDIDELLSLYVQARPQKNLNFLESHVHARLQQRHKPFGFTEVLGTGFSQLPLRFAAIAVALTVSTGLGLMPLDTSITKSDFIVSSYQSPYLPSVLLN